MKRSMNKENLCEKLSFFKAFNSIAANGQRSETLRIIFLFFKERTKTDINESNNGGDWTTTF